MSYNPFEESPVSIPLCQHEGCRSIAMSEKVAGPSIVHRKDPSSRTGHADVIIVAHAIRFLTKCFYHSSIGDNVGRETGTEWAYGRRPRNWKHTRDYVIGKFVK